MTETPSIDSEAVVWSAPPEQRPGRALLVLLHGYGADERDLFGLVPHLPPDFVVAAVRAPLNPPWPAPGYSWYAIEGLDGRSAQGATDAASALLAWLDTLGDTLPEAPTVGLLGFSQGGAVALQAMRLQPERFAFAVNLSGYVTPGSLPRDAELAELRPPVFWGRGTHDEVIPEALVAHTVQWLPGYVDLSGRVYPGLAHGIAEQELADVQVFLEKQLAAIAPDEPSGAADTAH